MYVSPRLIFFAKIASFKRLYENLHFLEWFVDYSIEWTIGEAQHNIK